MLYKLKNAKKRIGNNTNNIFLLPNLKLSTEKARKSFYKKQKMDQYV